MTYPDTIPAPAPLPLADFPMAERMAAALALVTNQVPAECRIARPAIWCEVKRYAQLVGLDS